MKTAVLFASKLGNTRNVSEYIAGRIGADIFDLKKTSPDVSSYDRVIIGTGVYAGKISKHVRNFIDSSESLKTKETHLFLCCMFDGEKGDKQLETISSAFPFISSKIYFNGKQKEPTQKVIEYAGTFV